MKALSDTGQKGARVAPGDALDLPLVRASLFDPLAPVDPWIERCRCSDLLALYLHNRPVAVFPASLFDLPALNQLLFRLRQRPPKTSGMETWCIPMLTGDRPQVIHCRRP